MLSPKYKYDARRSFGLPIEKDGNLSGLALSAWYCNSFHFFSLVLAFLSCFAYIACFSLPNCLPKSKSGETEFLGLTGQKLFASGRVGSGVY